MGPRSERLRRLTGRPQPSCEAKTTYTTNEMAVVFGGSAASYSSRRIHCEERFAAHHGRHAIAGDGHTESVVRIWTPITWNHHQLDRLVAQDLGRADVTDGQSGGVDGDCDQLFRDGNVWREFDDPL